MFKINAEKTRTDINKIIPFDFIYICIIIRLVEFHKHEEAG